MFSHVISCVFIAHMCSHCNTYASILCHNISPCKLMPHLVINCRRIVTKDVWTLPEYCRDSRKRILVSEFPDPTQQYCSKCCPRSIAPANTTAILYPNPATHIHDSKRFESCFSPRTPRPDSWGRILPQESQRDTVPVSRCTFACPHFASRLNTAP